MKLRMGTRGSALARAQSNWVSGELRRYDPFLAIETVVIKTSGDKFATQQPDAAMKLAGGKGLFVKEIEGALIRGEIDFAVHSAKDLPGELSPALEIAAYPRRADARDVFVGRGGSLLAAMAAGARVATSSLRRRVQLLAARPDLTVVPMRGNVDTRLRKLAQGHCDGLLLAAAGLQRLGRSDVSCETLDVEVMVPAPGQGALAIEAHEDRRELLAGLAVLDHRETRLAVECERAFLRAFGGGCATPLGAHARLDGGRLELLAFWSEPDGSGARRLRESCDDPERRAEFGAALAERLRGT